MTTFERIDKVIKANLPRFKKPGALTVRPGYKIRNQWITDKPAIVVTVAKKLAATPTQNAIPKTVGGYVTDVREATTLQKLRRRDPQRHAVLMATQRPEYRMPQFPLERDAQTGELLDPAAPPTAVTELSKVPSEPYTPAPGVTLAPVTDKMSIICHASPDAGWVELSRFLQGIQDHLTVGIYDFTSGHVMDAVKAGLAGNQKLSLVLDHPAPNPTADQSDEETERQLSSQLGAREGFAWAAEANDPMVTKAIFPNAYHIKVAVKDHTSFWLSSGNWNNSNQPQIDPFDPNAKKAQIDKIAKKSDRDWHVVVTHPGLAQIFEAYLNHDLKVAGTIQAGKSAVQDLLSSLPPHAEAVHPEKPIHGSTAQAKYFKPFQIVDEKMTVRPVLTPDAGVGNYVQNFLNLIQGARKKLYIQTQYLHTPQPGTYQGFQSLIDALKDKIKKRLDVRLIFSEYESTGGWLEKLKEAGIDTSVVRIQNGVHNKGFVVDSTIVALGSQNWSGDGVELNRDASLIIEHQGAAQYFESIFLHDWETLAKQKLTYEKSSLGTRKSAGKSAKVANGLSRKRG